MTFKNYLHTFFFAAAFLIPPFSFSQNIPLIHLKKEGSFIFFQKGIKSDSIIKNKSDRFYLYLPDSLRQTISVLTENGQFQRAVNDTIFKFVYLPGLKYESFYTVSESKNKYDFKTLINGASDFGVNKVRIQIFDKQSGTTVLENVFFYRQ